MGPPSEDGGNPTAATKPCYPRSGFNGAAVRRRRKFFRRRPCEASQSSFNGAAVRRRRKSPKSPAILECYAGASMGPPSEDGGNCTPAAPSTARSTLQWGRRPKTAEMAANRSATAFSFARFNGAAVRRRRKCLVARFTRTRQTASMGPPSEDGGNKSMSVKAWEEFELQWGRRPKTAEISRCA